MPIYNYLQSFSHPFDSLFLSKAAEITIVSLALYLSFLSFISFNSDVQLNAFERLNVQFQSY